MDALTFNDRIKDYLGRQFNLPEDQVAMMMPEFKKTLSKHMENLEEVYSSESLSNLEKAAHTIKGAFLNLGLSDCAEIAMQIEGAAAQQDQQADYELLIGSMGAIVREIVEE